MLRRVLITTSAIYLLGVVLTGFTFMMGNSSRISNSYGLVAASVDRGMFWPFQLVRVVRRVIR